MNSDEFRKVAAQWGRPMKRWPLILVIALAWIGGFLAGMGMVLKARKPVLNPPAIRFDTYVKPELRKPLKVCASDKKPCVMVPIFADKELQIPLANPIWPDPYGNVTFYAKPGIIRLEVQ